MLSVSEWAEGREESPTVAAEGRRYGSHAGPNAAGRRPPEPPALRGRWGRLRHRLRSHRAVGTMRLPCSWSPEGQGGPQAGTPARRGHPVSWRAGVAPGVSRATGGGRAARGSWRVGSAPVVASSPRGKRAEPPRAQDASTRDSVPLARPSALATWGCRGGGEMEPPWLGTARLGLVHLPRPLRLRRGCLAHPEALAPGPGGHRRLAASPQGAASEGQLSSDPLDEGTDCLNAIG